MTCKYFLSCGGLPFMWLMVSFAMQELFSLMSSRLFVFAFAAFALRIRSHHTFDPNATPEESTIILILRLKKVNGLFSFTRQR